MIDIKPTPGNYTSWLESEVGLDNPINQPAPLLFDQPPVHKSTVLAPNGQPVEYNIPRRKVGFILPHEKRR